MEHLRISRADWQAMAAFLIKETALSKTMEARTTTRQILSRSEGAAAEAANMHHHRHLLIRQGDGRYLYMRAISNEEVKEALAESPAITTATFDWNELREEMDVLVTAEIVEEGYLHYLKPNEDFRSMDFEDKVDLCAHGRLMVRYTRPTVPRNAVPAPVHDSDGSPAASGV